MKKCIRRSWDDEERPTMRRISEKKLGTPKGTTAINIWIYEPVDEISSNSCISLIRSSTIISVIYQGQTYQFPSTTFSMYKLIKINQPIHQQRLVQFTHMAQILRTRFYISVGLIPKHIIQYRYTLFIIIIYLFI